MFSIYIILGNHTYICKNAGKTECALFSEIKIIWRLKVTFFSIYSFKKEFLYFENVQSGNKQISFQLFRNLSLLKQ